MPPAGAGYGITNKNKKRHMKSIIIILLGIIFLSSCNNTTNSNDTIKKAEEKCRNKEQLYESKINIKNETIRDLKREKRKSDEENEALNNKLTAMSGIIGADIKDSESFNTLEEDHNLSYFKKNKNIFNFGFNLYLLNGKAFLSNLVDGEYLVYKESYSDLPVFEEFKNLWNNIDRSSISLEKLYTDNDKRFIYLLFAHNDYYKKTGMQCMVEGLLRAYEEMHENEELLENIYHIAADDEDDTDIWNYLETEIATKEMRSILSDENYANDGDFNNRIFYVYTFWARRYNEGNMDFVYKIMKDFHQNVKND